MNETVYVIDSYTGLRMTLEEYYQLIEDRKVTR